MSRSKLSLLILSALMVLGATAARADSLTTGGYYSGNQNDFVNGMITFSLGGVTQSGAAGNITGSSVVISGKNYNLAELFCVDIPDNIYLNSTYNATINAAGNIEGSAMHNAGEIAWLLLNRPVAPGNTDANEALQAAIWSVEYPTFSLLTASNDPTMVTAFQADMTALGTNTASTSSVLWITPTNSNGSFAQAQVGLAVTPEPNSICLLGTGLAGVLAAARRRLFRTA